MTPLLVATLLAAYFGVLLLIASLTGRRATHRSFIQGNRTAHWLIIAFGMIGVSLSGISFISVPGWVRSSNFYYLQMVLGYIVGYYAIAYILLPVYYRLRIPSIYSYLSDRFGLYSYKSGAGLFLVSRTVICAFRLFVVASVLHELVFGPWGIPFAVTVLATLVLIWLYTHRAGIQTIIWTDTFQTAVMLLALILSIVCLCRALDFSLPEAVRAVANDAHSRIFLFDDWRSPHHFLKQFLSGALIPVVMTGLDQDMMQKNLACRTLRDAQRNMVAYGYAFLPINLLLLGLGVLLLIFAHRHAIPLPAEGDRLYPFLATGGWLPPVVGLLFTLGVIAATFSSADSALTALTTSFTLDILGRRDSQPRALQRTLRVVHLALAALLAAVVLLFRYTVSGSVIHALFTAVGYTYGPLLGLYAFGLFTPWRTREPLVPLIVLLAPALSYGAKVLVAHLWDYTMGYELLLLNGLLAFGLLWITRRR